jgi:hypothetical protein
MRAFYPDSQHAIATGDVMMRCETDTRQRIKVLPERANENPAAKK